MARQSAERRKAAEIIGRFSEASPHITHEDAIQESKTLLRPARTLDRDAAREIREGIWFREVETFKQFIARILCDPTAPVIAEPSGIEDSDIEFCNSFKLHPVAIAAIASLILLMIALFAKL